MISLAINNRYRLRDGTKAIVLRRAKLQGAHGTREDVLQGRDEENGIDLFWDANGRAADGGEHPKDCVKKLDQPMSEEAKAALHLAGAPVRERFSAADRQLVGKVDRKLAKAARGGEPKKKPKKGKR